MAGKYPQDSYSTVVCAIQPEIIFLKRVTKDTGYALEGVDNILWGTFLTCLFFGKLKYLPPIVGNLSTMPVNKFDLGLQDMVASSNKKYLSSLHVSRELIGFITGEREFPPPTTLWRSGKKGVIDKNP